MTQDSSNIDYDGVFARFWSKVWIKTDIDACWPWMGAIVTTADGKPVGFAAYPTGYTTTKKGGVRRKFVTIPAARMAAVAMQMCGYRDRVKNTCGDRTCCNPRHLQVLPLPEPKRYNAGKRSKSSLGSSKDAFYRALHPLTQDRSVLITMNDPKVRVIKKFQGHRLKVIALVPGPLLGVGRENVLVSVIGSGSTVVRLDRPPKVANLVLAGMPAELAKGLMDKLYLVFQEK